jgi:hypothetical protein
LDFGQEAKRNEDACQCWELQSQATTQHTDKREATAHGRNKGIRTGVIGTGDGLRSWTMGPICKRVGKKPPDKFATCLKILKNEVQEADTKPEI